MPTGHKSGTSALPDVTGMTHWGLSIRLREGSKGNMSAYDPQRRPDYPQQPRPQQGQQYRQQPQPYQGVHAPAPGQRGHQQPPAGYQAQQPRSVRRYALRGAESFWYLLGCIGFGMAYFSKIPAKKAACEVLSVLQLDGQGPGGYSLRGAEGFWYALMCLAFGGGYFAKLSAKRALWEVVTALQSDQAGVDAISRALHAGAR